MDFDLIIDDVAKKYSYDNELVEALKRCVPVMAEGKSKLEIELLIQALNQVQIFDFMRQPTQEQIDEILNEKIKGRNNHIKIEKADLGEYGKGVAPGAYAIIPIFDQNMNIIDNVEYLYTTRLYEYGRTAEFYKTPINLSHLIHELGHAWASQQEACMQEENGNYYLSIGSYSSKYKVNREEHMIIEEQPKGLLIEEALNTLEEEKVLCKVLGINSVKEIPEYVSSNYQGNMSDIMKKYVDIIGELPFSKYRILKDKTDLEQYQDIFLQTKSWNKLGTKERIDEKRKVFSKIDDLNISEKAKEEIHDFFVHYDGTYFSSNLGENFTDKLENVFEQIFYIKKLAYKFGLFQYDMNTNKFINNENNLSIYSVIYKEILKEGHCLINEATPAIQEFNAKKNVVSINDLAKQSLESNPRSSEVDDVSREHKIQENTKEEGEQNI